MFSQKVPSDVTLVACGTGVRLDLCVCEQVFLVVVLVSETLFTLRTVEGWESVAMSCLNVTIQG